MTTDEMTAILVKLGRIEEILSALGDKLDRLEQQTEKKFMAVDIQTDRQWKKIAEHDTEIRLLKDRQGPKIHWMTWASGAAAVAAVIVSILDRMFK